jgi:protocatechuate 3,4-dioxygenase beta subunit
MYIEGEPGNARDGVLGWISDPRQRSAVVVRLDKAPDGKALAGRFDIVLRATT